MTNAALPDEQVPNEYEQPEPASLLSVDVLAWLESALRNERQLAALTLEGRHRELLASLELALGSCAVARVQDPQMRVVGKFEPRHLFAESLADPSFHEKRPSHMDEVSDAVKKDGEVSESPLSLSGSQKRTSFRSQPKRRSFIRAGAEEATTFKAKDRAMGRIVTSHRYEIFCAFFIILNAIFITVDFQYQGLVVNAQENFLSGPASVEEVWPAFVAVRELCSLFFGFFFTLELFMKIVGLHRYFFSSLWNLFDVALVGIWNVDYWFMTMSAIANPLLLRLLRLIRLLKLLRLLGTFSLVHTLMLMISSIKMSLMVVVWGAVLLGLVIVVTGLAIQSQMASILVDPDVEFAERYTFYLLFGTFTRTVITMFEVTLGNYVPVCRQLLEQAGEGWAFVILFYRLVVSFTVLKVVTAVITCETFKAASMDDNLMIQSRLIAKNRFLAKMEAFMVEADLDGDEHISLHEFEAVLEEPRVRAWLQAMELNIHDPRDAFAYCMPKRGKQAEVPVEQAKISFHELTLGLGRLRGSAQTCDLLEVVEEVKLIRSGELPQLCRATEELRQSLALLRGLLLAQGSHVSSLAPAGCQPSSAPLRASGVAQGREQLLPRDI